MRTESNHKHKIKRIFSHGRNSKPKWFCKICGEIISRKEVKKQMLRPKKVFKTRRNK